MELAGVILGAVSLAGPTYKLYKRCSQLILDVRQYEKRLKGCSDSFNIQKGLYTETWALALSLVGVEADLAIVMLEDENHPQWKDPDFLNLWNEALGEHFDAGVRVTQATLKKIEGILQRVQECREETKQDSFIKASKAAVDERFWKLGWGWKGKDDLRTLINTLRVQNQDLKNMRDQREASRKTWVRKPREPKSYSDSDVMLAHLLAVREVSKTLHDSLTGMSACSCHDINLRLQFDINETLEAILDPKLASPILQARSSLPTIIRIARFRLIVTKEDKDDGSTSQPIRNCSGTCMVITSVLQAGESNTGVLQLKRRMSVESQNHGLPRKRVRFADNQVVETSSPWAAVISDGAGSEEERVLHLEPELETKRLKVTSKGNSQPATSDGGAVEQSEIMVATPPSDLVANSTIPRVSMSPSSVAEIDNLCSLMQKLVLESPGNRCLGQIKSRDTARRHFIYCNQPGVLRTPRVSLETILDEMTLVRDDRLRISLTLSKSLLHLGSYSGSFFQEQWRSRDIFFFQGLQNPSLTDTVGEPYIVPIFGKAPDSLEAKPEPSDEIPPSPARSEQLFSLALTFIEIGFGKRLWKIPSPFKIPGEAGSIEEFMKAKTILDSKLLEREMGVEFANVVKRCFYCDFGIDEDDLCKKELQEVFYTKVVAPLEGYLARHLGGFALG